MRSPGDATDRRRTPLKTCHLSLALLVAMASCGGGDDLAPPPPCNSPINVSISSGTTPTFSWTPECGISGVSVVPLPNSVPEVMWAIHADASTLGSPIVYGTGGSTPKALVQGQLYEVTFSVHAEVEYGDGIVGVGDSTLVRTQFTP